MSDEVKQEATKQEEKSLRDETDEEILLRDNMKERTNKRDSMYQEDNDEDEGIDYPLDIWFILSEYIPPEAVGKFARICKSSYHVTTTAKFWFNLYKSYQVTPDTPSLQCEIYMTCRPMTSMVIYGLRSCVINALHQGYFKMLREKDKNKNK